jgi:AmpE protein
MSLISLLIALAAERSLSSSTWSFHTYFQAYRNFFTKKILVSNTQADDKKNHGKAINATSIAFIVLPVIAIGFLLSIIDNGLIHVALSTVILIICLGCTATRDSYKHYLNSAFRGEETTTELHHQQLLSDKNLPQMGFGQALVWLNYRYYIAITLFFIAFGAAGAVFYRLLTSVIEQQNKTCQEKFNAQRADDAVPSDANRSDEKSNDEGSSDTANCEAKDNEIALTEAMATVDDVSISAEVTENVDATPIDSHPTENDSVVTNSVSSDSEKDAEQEPINDEHESNTTPRFESGCNNHHDILFWVDWLPVRVTSFGYMFVGHFSKAMPVWLENCFDFNKPTHQVLIDVAEKSEDILVDEHDCTAEPCLLVRLAKRNALFILAVIAILTLTGVLA